MKVRSVQSSVALLPLLALSTAYSGAAVPADKQRSGEDKAFLRENDIAMRQMMAGMAVAPTGDVDRDFARMMIPHHEGGIDMARALLRHGRNERMKALASAIIVKQQEEIALMRRMIGEPAGAGPGRTMPMPMSMPMRMSAGADNHRRMAR